MAKIIFDKIGNFIPIQAQGPTLTPCGKIFCLLGGQDLAA